MVADLRDVVPPLGSPVTEPPSMPLVSSEEKIELEESYQEEEVKIEEACKEVEEFKEEHKGGELARPLPKPSPSNTTFKWVKFLSLLFHLNMVYWRRMVN